jgi:hypothetical protein
VDITFLGYPLDKDICFSFVYQIRILHFYYSLKFRDLGQISDFHIFNPTQISMFLDHLFISQISENPDIKNSKKILPIMLCASFFFWLKNLQKGKSFILTEYFVTNSFF